MLQAAVSLCNPVALGSTARSPVLTGKHALLEQGLPERQGRENSIRDFIMI